MILIDVNGANAIVRKQDTLTSGMVGATVVFRFGEDWNSLAKTAVFRAGNVTKDAVVEDSMSEIPHEVLATHGYALEIGVYGTAGNGAVVIPTVWAKTNPIKYGADPSGDESLDPSLPVWAQMQEQINILKQPTSASARVINISLPASKWTGSGSLYKQVVSISGITANSQVNLTPNVDQLSIFYDKDITFVTENDGGVVTIYVIGQKPQNDYTIQANIVEVI